MLLTTIALLSSLHAVAPPSTPTTFNNNVHHHPSTVMREIINKLPPLPPNQTPRW